MFIPYLLPRFSANNANEDNMLQFAKEKLSAEFSKKMIAKDLRISESSLRILLKTGNFKII